MKVLLLQDVYKLGRAGDVKKVAKGYGRNYLIPQGLAVLATPGAMKQAERIRTEADVQRAVLNKEMTVVSERLQDVVLTFPARASETGRLYGSVNTRMLAEAISEQAGIEISHRQIDSQPLRYIGEHQVSVRLTVDLIPEIHAVVYREGETPAMAIEEAKALEEAGTEITDAEADITELYADYEPPEEVALEAEEETEAEAEPEAEEENKPETEAEADPELDTEITEE
jgi:large subunit ribosomal protein L9